MALEFAAFSSIPVETFRWKPRASGRQATGTEPTESGSQLYSYKDAPPMAVEDASQEPSVSSEDSLRQAYELARTAAAVRDEHAGGWAPAPQQDGFQQIGCWAGSCAGAGGGPEVNMLSWGGNRVGGESRDPGRLGASPTGFTRYQYPLKRKPLEPLDCRLLRKSGLFSEKSNSESVSKPAQTVIEILKRSRPRLSTRATKMLAHHGSSRGPTPCICVI